MLKIKEDKIQELERFGFKKLTYTNGDVYKFTRYSGNHEIRNVIVSIKDRILQYNDMSKYNELDDIVFDLIKADMVEE